MTKASGLKPLALAALALSARPGARGSGARRAGRLTPRSLPTRPPFLVHRRGRPIRRRRQRLERAGLQGIVIQDDTRRTSEQEAEALSRASLRAARKLKTGEGGLAAPSVLLCEQITTVPQGGLDATTLGGPLSAARIGEVEQAVLRAIGIP